MPFSKTPHAHGNTTLDESQARSQTSPPLAFAKLERTRDGVAWKWTVERCPLCGKTHHHGGGDGDKPSGGHRVGHCRTGGRTGYDLVEAAQ